MRFFSCCKSVFDLSVLGPGIKVLFAFSEVHVAKIYMGSPTNIFQDPNALSNSYSKEEKKRRSDETEILHEAECQMESREDKRDKRMILEHNMVMRCLCKATSVKFQAERTEEESDCQMSDGHNVDERHSPSPTPAKEEAPPFFLLSVHIIRLRNLRQTDWFSQSDCYISLRLPTSSFVDVQTKTISNCRNPVWNETFYYRIQSMAKNVLELRVCDEDTLFSDDSMCTILFDIAHLQPGETLCKHFELNHKKDELLEVEFSLEQMPDLPESLVTNGVLLVCIFICSYDTKTQEDFYAEWWDMNWTRELCCLKVEMDGRNKWNKCRSQPLSCTVKGSHEDTQKISLCSHGRNSFPNSTVFHYPKHCNIQMQVELPKRCCACASVFYQPHYFLCSKLEIKEMCSSDKKGSLIFPLRQLPIGDRVEIIHDKAYNVCLTAGNCQRDLDVRLGYDICSEEQDFIRKRKKYVAPALKNVLQLGEDLQDDEVPIVAIMTTAGGARSMIGMFGSLLGLQKLNLLDCFSYVTGLSGTTWTMVNLYENADWSHRDLEKPISEARKHATKNKLSCFSVEHLKYYDNEIWQRHLEGHKISFTDLWGLLIGSMFNEKSNPQKLSDQRQTVNCGQNPLPIYLALNVKNRYSTLDFKEWVEFTPYEVGILKYGAFVKAEDFGSEFFMGRLMKRIPESRVCFMQGLWSNVFSTSLLDALYFAGCSEDFWHRWTRDKIVEMEDNFPYRWPKRPYVPPTRLFIPEGSLTNVLRDTVTLRPIFAQYHNFTKGLQLNNKYLENDRFCTWKDTVIDSSPNQLRDSVEHLNLVDAAYFLNTSCPPLLRPERKVDLILHLNYSGGKQTLPLDRSTCYYAEQGIPFPKVDLTEEDKKNLKECYLFDQADNPKAPMLLYFPLVCDTFQKYKAPGVERSPSEMEEGQADVSSPIFSPYATGLLQYSEENFNKLVNLASYNILNNKHFILKALHKAVERKKQQKKQFLSSGS